jgi:hypothetical protein
MARTDFTVTLRPAPDVDAVKALRGCVEGSATALWPAGNQD